MMAPKESVEIDAQTALLVIDMQRAFLERKGRIRVPDGQSIIPRLIKLIRYARKKDCEVIWTRISTDLMPPLYRKMYPEHFDPRNPVLAKNGEDFEIVDSLAKHQRSDDLVVDKFTYDAFLFTELELYLRRRNIQQLLFTGVSTSVCVESTLRHAFQLGFDTILVSDCTHSVSRALQRSTERLTELAFGSVIPSYILMEDL